MYPDRFASRTRPRNSSASDALIPGYVERTSSIVSNWMSPTLIENDGVELDDTLLHESASPSSRPAATLYPLKCLMRRVILPVSGLRTVMRLGSFFDSS